MVRECRFFQQIRTNHIDGSVVVQEMKIIQMCVVLKQDPGGRDVEAGPRREGCGSRTQEGGVWKQPTGPRREGVEAGPRREGCGSRIQEGGV